MQHAAAAPIICKEVLDRIDVVVFVRVLLHIPAVPGHTAEHNTASRAKRPLPPRTNCNRCRCRVVETWPKVSLCSAQQISVSGALDVVFVFVFSLGLGLLIRGLRCRANDRVRCRRCRQRVALLVDIGNGMGAMTASE